MGIKIPNLDFQTLYVSMKKYRIVNRPVEKPLVKYIRCFLANDEYNEEIDNVEHRSKTLCWIGVQVKLEKRIRELGDVRKVIEEEIVNFRLRSLFVIDEIHTLGGREKALRMVFGVEDFIKKTIYNTID